MIIYRNEHSYTGPISMLAPLASGDIVLVFREALGRGFAAHCDPTTRTSLLRSSDGGETWHSLVTPDPAGGNGTTVTQLSDGALLVTNFHWVYVPLDRKAELAAMGRVIEMPQLGLAFGLEGIYTVRSRTDGYTWEPARRVETGEVLWAGTAGRVVELDDGTLVMPINGRRAGDEAVRACCLRSADGGETWGEPVDMAAPPLDLHETRLAVLPAGDIPAMMRTQEGNFMACRSADGGRTWGDLVETPLWCGGSSPGDLLLLRDGRLLCAYGHRREPFGVRACLSEDGGRTWDVEREVVLRDDGPDSDMGYPSSVQLDDDRILTVYYWHGEDGVRYLEGTTWQA